MRCTQKVCTSASDKYFLLPPAKKGVNHTCVATILLMVEDLKKQCCNVAAATESPLSTLTYSLKNVARRFGKGNEYCALPFTVATVLVER